MTPRKPEGKPVYCETDDCPQVVYIRKPGGALYPTSAMYVDAGGRPVVVCPVCKKVTILKKGET